MTRLRKAVDELSSFSFSVAMLIRNTHQTKRGLQRILNNHVAIHLTTSACRRIFEAKPSMVLDDGTRSTLNYAIAYQALGLETHLTTQQSHTCFTRSMS